jgi:microsomal dipeptidase-like Zn-dependent dipeptidase
MRKIGSSMLKTSLAIACALTTAQPANAAVEGFVEMHSHLMGEHAFGGSWFWGRSEGAIDSALARCDGNFGYGPGMGTHGATIFPGISEALGGDTGWHLGRRNGYDTRRCRYLFGFIPIPGTCPTQSFTGWPQWDAIAHQQMWTGWMQDAHRRGLRVLAVSFAESNFLCRTTPPTKRRYDCDEMASVKRQAAFLRNYAWRNSSWVGIAETPLQARQLIAQGKLALVMTAEITQLFPQGDYLQQLDELHALGIRSIQFTHHADNRFAGTVAINELRAAGSIVEYLTNSGITTGINDTVCRNPSGGIDYEYLQLQGATIPLNFLRAPKCNGDTHLNERGLSPDGRALMSAMMDRGMILDIAHSSRKVFAEAYQIASARSMYPINSSHTHVWETMRGEKNEKYLKQDEIEKIVATGGMIGLRTGPEHTNTYIRPPMAAPYVANTCQGSTRSFAQSLMYSIDKGLNVGFGADLNGFIKQMHGINERTKVGPGAFVRLCQHDINHVNSLGGMNDYHHKGVAHVGLLPDLVADLKRVGVPQSYMDHIEKTSAERFLVMWERSQQIAGLGNGNIAPSANASASSTYCMVGALPTSPNCYAAWRVNDGDASSALSGQSSWANDQGVAMPQWVQLEWTAPVNMSRVVMTTTIGYEVQDYDVQVWIGPPQVGGWQTVASVNSNTSITNTHVFPQVTTWRMRILSRSGSAQQPGYARVNEIAAF